MSVESVQGSAVRLLAQQTVSQSDTNDMFAEATTKRAKLKKATQGFEAMFLNQMLKEVHKSMSENNPLFGNSYQAKFYQEMMDEQISDRLSKSGSFGLASTLYQKLERTLPPDPREIVRKAELLGV